MSSTSQDKEELIRVQLCAQGLTIQRTLGMGGFGEVFHVTDNDGNDHALKLLTIPKQDNSIVAAAYSFEGGAGVKRREMSVGKYRHRNIQQYRGSGVITVDGREVGYTLSELVDGETLDHLLQRQQEEGTKKCFDFTSVMEQIVSAVAEIHHNAAVHNDLKLDNVMLDRAIPNRVVVLDFGNSLSTEVIARVKEYETPVFPLPSKRYRAPEIVTGKEISYRSDIWSLGIMMYQLLTGENPKQIVNERGMSIDALVNENIPRRFRKIITTSLEEDPARRYADASVLLQELQHARSYYARRIFWIAGVPSLTALAGIFLFTASEKYIRQLEERYTRECAYLLDTEPTLEAAQEAEQFCRRALGLNKQNIDASISLGHSLIAQGKEEEAKKEYEHALNVAQHTEENKREDTFTPVDVPHIIMRRVLELREQGKKEDAKTILEFLRSIDHQRNDEYSKTLFDILMENKEYARASATVQEMGDTEEISAVHFYQLGVWHQEQQNLKSALYFAKGAVAKEREHIKKDDLASYLFLVGDISFAQKSYDVALVAYQEANRINPERPEAFVNIGEIWLQNGNYSGAKEVLERAEAMYLQKIAYTSEIEITLKEKGVHESSIQKDFFVFHSALHTIYEKLEIVAMHQGYSSHSLKRKMIQVEKMRHK